MSKFSAQHYNAISKEIRELFNTDWADADDMNTSKDLIARNNARLQRGTLAALALNLAKRFNTDNERFDPHKFLDACSPNTDLYPLSELWEEVDG